VLENEGDGILQFDITTGHEVGKLLGNNKSLSNSCLTLEPLKGVIKAGEKITVTVKLEIGQREAQLLFLYRDLSETIDINTNEQLDVNRHHVNIGC
jgi:hypothetical protein